MFRKILSSLLVCFLLSTALVFTGCKDTPDITDPNATETPGQESESEFSTDKKDDTSKSDDATTDAAADDGTSDDGDAGDPTPKPSVLPVIRITTTSEVYKTKDFTDPLAFVKEPVSDSVKIHAHTYNSSDYDSAPKPWYESCIITVTDESNNVVKTDVTAQVKSRGNYTTTYPKKGLRIKFSDAQTMLGLHNDGEYKNWVLLGCWKDLSMLRDYSAYKLAHLINNNYYAADAKLVEVYVNDQYWGVYLLTEQQEDKRVDVKAKENDGKTEVGYLLEYDAYSEITNNYLITGNSYNYDVEEDYFIFGNYAPFTDLNNAPMNDSQFRHGYTIKTDYDNDKKAFIKNYMEKLWVICRDAIQDGTYKEFDASYNLVDSTATSAQECISKVVDIDSLVATYILQELACDLDLNWSSFYMDLDLAKGKKLTFEAPWDFDSCFGNHKERQIGDDDINHLYAATQTSSAKGYPCGNGNPWTILFAKAPWFQEKVRDKWAEMKTANVKGQIINEINRISNDKGYVEAFARNYARWDNMEHPNGELPSAAASSKNQRQAANHFINYLNQRFAMLDKDFVSFTPSNVIYQRSASTTYTSSYDNVKKKGSPDEVRTPRDYSVTLTVTATNDGLRITKDCDSYWEHSTIKIEKDGVDSSYKAVELDGVSQNENTLVYEHVSPDSVYRITLIQMDEDWQGWHATETVAVQAIGGSGDIYVRAADPTFNYVSEGSTITFGLFDYSSGLPTIRYEATLFNGTVWGTDVRSGNGRAVQENDSNTIVITDLDNIWTQGGQKGIELKLVYNRSGCNYAFKHVILSTLF